MPVITEYQDVGHCGYCGFEWSLHNTRATNPQIASVDPAQFGDRCPFCNSAKVTISKEAGVQTLTT